MRILAIGVFQLLGDVEHLSTNASNDLSNTAAGQMYEVLDHIRHHQSQNGHIYKLQQTPIFHYAKIDGQRIYIISSEDSVNRDEIILHFSDIVELAATDKYYKMGRKMTREDFETPKIKQCERKNQFATHLMLLDIDEVLDDANKDMEDILFQTEFFSPPSFKMQQTDPFIQHPKSQSFFQKMGRYCGFFSCCAPKPDDDLELEPHLHRQSKLGIN